MPESIQRRHRTPSFWFVLALALAIPLGLFAQGGQGGGGGRGGGGRGGGAPAAGAPAVPGGAPGLGGPAAAAPAGQGRGGAPGGGGGARGAAPVDLTGYWVSLVTEDWVERMCPDCPRSGTNASRGGGGGGGGGVGRGGPGGAPAAAAATPDPCRVYGAGGSMRMPGRLNITWADDNTLKIDMDSGTQTRLLHFGVTQPPNTEKTLQGYSIATWEAGGGGGGGRGGGGGGARGGGGAPAARWASLAVVTTNMKSGYLLTSRSSYSENATLTEYFFRTHDFDDDHITVIATLTDPNGGNRTTSSTFKKEPNGSKFSPSGCDIVK